MSQGTTPPGWYDDGQGAQRWWDGNGWTDHTQPADVTQMGPQPTQPPATPPYGQPASATGTGSGKGKLYAIIGAAAVAVVLAVVLLAVLLGGGGGAEGTAKDYLGAQADLDFEGACDLTAADLRRTQLEAVEAESCEELAEKSDEFVTDEIKGYYDDITIDIEIDDVSEDGDEAQVDYTVSSEYTGDDEDGFKEAFDSDDLEETNEGTLDLVKEDGDWLVTADE
ncbi:MAG: hypothetical protein JWN84_4406 [Nocardioides sp.]|jgi:hypothetical protein|nr:hypothetical protein [Nocardioides sp.]